MSITSTHCPGCQRLLAVSTEFSNVMCPACGTSYRVFQYEETVGLSAIWPEEHNRHQATDARSAIASPLLEIEELITDTESEIETLRSREQSRPLQIGCAFFGLLLSVIGVVALFVLLGRASFGGWVFYALIVAVVLLGLLRIRRKLASSLQPVAFRKARARLEKDLAGLKAERRRLRGSSPEPQLAANPAIRPDRLDD